MTWLSIIDISLSFLLVVMIAFAFLLNRKLRDLRDNRIDFEKTSAGFVETMSRAEACIAALKSSADSLQDRLHEALKGQEDLDILIRRAESAADRLERAVRASRGPARAAEARPSPAAPPAREEGLAGLEPRSEAERELLRALAAGAVR